MKKLSLLFLLPILLFSCSSDDNEPKQDYTSFVFMQPYIDIQSNVVIGYKNEASIYVKVADLGDLKKGVYSNEIRVNKNISELCLFSDHPYPTFRLDTSFKLTKNIKNIFIPEEKTKGIEVKDKKDPTQYPQ